jgi:hypothetical protein
MSSHTMEDLTSCILDFQANMVRVTYRKKMTPVDPESNFSHAADLRFLWETSKLQEEVDENGDLLRWRNLGFDSEDIEHEFNNVGVLGLECLVRLLGLVLLIDLPHLFFLSEIICPKRRRFLKGSFGATQPAERETVSDWQGFKRSSGTSIRTLGNICSWL